MNIGYMTKQQLVAHYIGVKKRIALAGDNYAAKIKSKEDAKIREAQEKEEQRLKAEERLRAIQEENLVPVQKLILEVANKYDLIPQDVVGPLRSRKNVLARHEFCYRARSELKLSLNRIGHFAKRDHTTVIHAIRMHAQRHGLETPEVD
jgi:chromosomal replication initiation ATPase DnaA